MKLAIPIALALIGMIHCNAPNLAPKPPSRTRINTRYEISSNDVKVKFQPPAPPYPPLAKAERIDGDVVLEISIDSNGIPLTVKAIDGPSELWGNAESYLLQWRFHPVMVDGKPQPTTFLFTAPYRLRK